MNGRLAAAVLIGVPLAALALLVANFSNDPNPGEPVGPKVYYASFDEPPRSLDPQVNYSSDGSRYVGAVYDTLLDYHYLKRPYELVPNLAKAVPRPEPVAIAEGKEGEGPSPRITPLAPGEAPPEGAAAGVRYRMELWDGILFQHDPCFANPAGTRELTAKDVEFSFKRIADPDVECPVYEVFSKIQGMQEFQDRLAEVRSRKPQKGKPKLPVHLQYEEAGPISGFRVTGTHSFEIVLKEAYPQILYWFAMAFPTPVPFEAVEHYDGKDGRDFFKEHMVGTGPFRVALWDKDSKIVLEKSPDWRGFLHPERGYPGTTYPGEGEAGDREAGLLDPGVIGKPVPFLDRIEFRYESESIPRFGKFLQGYYDASGVPKESFSRVVQDKRISPEMDRRGITLSKSIGLDVYYMGFNMDDPVVGGNARKLRQALNLAYDVQQELHIFSNDRGVPAQSPIPPGIFGYEEEYRNAFRRFDSSLSRAKALLAEAGYPGGIDPKTRKPLDLTYDVGDASPQTLTYCDFAVRAWKELGVSVRVEATDYSKFQEKMKEGAFQIFHWGWLADYPDPENFLFLLYGPMGRSKSDGPNTANFSNARYDFLFEKMRAIPNDGFAEWEEKDPAGGASRKVRMSRLEIIREMRRVSEKECPWILGSHSEDYGLYHSWVKHQKPYYFGGSSLKYIDVDAKSRRRLRREWNPVVRWPVFALLAAAVLVSLPAVRTYLRERP